MPRHDHRTSLIRPLDRRRFLASTTVAAACWPFAEMHIAEAADRRIKMGDNPFQLGVASGEPAPNGIVLWTRLATQPLTPDGGMPPEDIRVEWQVAGDEKMTKVVRKGTTNAPADWGHSVHVEVEGLEPDRTYWYQFKHGTETSPIGRTRTAPRPDALLTDFRFAFASCQHYETGYYNAYEHMAQDDLRVVVHLGDYIYDGASRSKSKTRPREHLGGKLKSLEDFRVRYAQYKLDSHLQAVHAAFPWLVTWDDHEVENNYAGLISENARSTSEAFAVQRANAYKVYYEHMPLRRASLPQGPDMQLYRNVRFGRLIQFAVLDTRQYRSDQPCGDGRKRPCPDVLDPQATMLGEQQERWLMKNLACSSAHWNVLAQQVPIARVDYGYLNSDDELVLAMDKWSGYDVARRRLLQGLWDHHVSNPVVLTGDVHRNWVNDLKIESHDENAPTVTTEFVGTSISSSGDGSKKPKYLSEVYSRNPFVRFYSEERGYVRCHITPERWQSDYRAIEVVSKPNQPCYDRASFIVEDGRPGAVRV